MNKNVLNKNPNPTELKLKQMATNKNKNCILIILYYSLNYINLFSIVIILGIQKWIHITFIYSFYFEFYFYFIYNKY